MAAGYFITGLLTVLITLQLLTKLERVGADEPLPRMCYDDNGREYLHGQQIWVDCNTCTCLDSNWRCTEIACSDPCFSSPCQNDGLCVKGDDLYYECTCARGYTGHNCEDELPSGACYDGLETLRNGATFTHDGCEQECRCLNGVITCNYDGCLVPECTDPVYSPFYCCPICWPEEKLGFCPVTSLSEIGTCEESCRHDVDCTGDQKCCFNGCGLSCTDPQSEPTAMCADSPCENGGTCLDIFSNVFICQCLPGFHGQHCEIPDGDPCYYNEVWYRDGQTQTHYCLDCFCNDGFFECYDNCAEKPGECPDESYYDYNYSYTCYQDSDCPAEEKCCLFTCYEPDKSGLSCTYYGIHLKDGESYHETCHFCECDRGEIHCDDLCVDEKPGTCPNVADGTVGICITECSHDTNCKGIEKCCSNGCGDVCASPQEAGVTASCYFDGDWHSDGQIFFSESHCGSCHCLNGSVVCRAPICPEIHCPFSQLIYVPTECCPICIEYHTNVGECPPVPTYTTSDLCVSTCDSDFYCELDEKCCPTACGGNSCVKSVSLGHVGMCPFLVYDSYYYAYNSECQIDDHCAADDKCCYDIFGSKVCLQSIPEGSVLCADTPCLNGGSCEEHWDSWTYICRCTDGYKGSNCEEIDDSCHETPSPCLNGRCTGYEAYPCECYLGYSGEFCEDSCDSTICQNGGSCTGYDYDYQPCVCALGFTGEFCENDLCGSNPCLNGGTCSGFDWFPCYCTYGYGGQFCDQEDVCRSEPCMNGGTCLSNIDYTYFNYDDDGYSSENSTLCLCLLGFAGDFCEQDLCISNPCENGGSCTGYDDTPCYCPYGFIGEYCEEDDPCFSSPCMNGGLCISELDDGYFGSYSYSWSSYSWSSDWFSGPCYCQPGFGGEFCEEENCESDICQNGGTCLGYEWWPCLCPGGYTGEYCEEEYEYPTWPSWFFSFYPLTNSSDYGPSSSHTSYDESKDEDGYEEESSYVDEEESADEEESSYVDEEESGDEEESSYVDEEESGDEEESSYVDEEESGDEEESSYVDEEESGDEEESSYVDEEDSSQVDEDGEKEADEDGHHRLDPCIPNPCSNDGICHIIDLILPIVPHYCECAPGFSGETCEEDIRCEDNYCLNGGVCIEEYGTHYCRCPKDVTGQFCEIISPCQGRPCHHGGRCRHFYGDIFSCTCPPGTSGETCEILHDDVCEYSPCLNFGSCIEFQGVADCSCVDGFTGRFCEIIIEDHVCPDGTLYPDTCLFDPCSVAGGCPKHPHARCESNYCGCVAEFYDEDGNVVECHDCEAEDVVTCVINQCDVTTCKSNPRAVCEVNYCGDGCEAEFYSGQGTPVDCEIDVTCTYNQQTYYIADQRDHKDACNTCGCTSKGQWDCTNDECPGRVVVQLGFSLEIDYDDILENLEDFKRDIIGQLAQQFGIGENNFKDVQVRRGSAIVEFKLVNEDDIDAEEVGNTIADELNSDNVEFEYDSETLSVIPGSVQEPMIIETEPDEDTNYTTIIVCAVIAVTVLFVVVVAVGCLVTKRKTKNSANQNTQSMSNLQAVNTVSALDNHYAHLEKDTLSGAVLYDNLGGATIQGSDNPTYVDIADTIKA